MRFGLLCEREEVFPYISSKNWVCANFCTLTCACGWKQKPLKRMVTLQEWYCVWQQDAIELPLISKVLISSFTMELNVWVLPKPFQDTSPQLSLAVPRWALKWPTHTGSMTAAPELCKFTLCSRHTTWVDWNPCRSHKKSLNSLQCRWLHPVAQGCSKSKGGEFTSLWAAVYIHLTVKNGSYINVLCSWFTHLWCKSTTEIGVASGIYLAQS